MALTKISRSLLDTGVSDSSDATAITIDSSENVGIGTTSPLAKFEVHGQSRFASSSTSAVMLIDADSTSTNGINIQSSYYGTAGYGPMKFSTGGSERMRITSDGNLFIAATSPEAEAKLHISSTSDLHQIVLSSGSHTAIGNSGSADYAEGVVAVQTVSSGNQLTIPVTSQTSLWRPMYVELMFVDGSYNSTSPNGGFAKCNFAALNSLSNFASLQTGGNVSSVSVSGMNLIVDFTTAYTGGIGSSDGLYMRYKILSLSPELFKAYDATLN